MKTRSIYKPFCLIVIIFLALPPYSAHAVTCDVCVTQLKACEADIASSTATAEAEAAAICKYTKGAFAVCMLAAQAGILADADLKQCNCDGQYGACLLTCKNETPGH